MPSLQQSPDRAMQPNRTRMLALPVFHGALPACQTVPVIPIRGASLNRDSIPTNGEIAELNTHDVEDFALAYLRNEYSPKPLDHGPLRPNNTAYIDGARILSNRTASPFEPLGRTMPSTPDRWMSLGRALRQYDPSTNTPTAAATLAATTNPSQRRALADAAALRALLAAARAPLAAVEQLEAAVKDFSRLNRFSRVRTKLARAGAFAALASRLLNDQALLAALWPPRATGFVMPADPVGRARRDVQDAGAAVFSRVVDADDFEPRRRSLLKLRLRLRLRLPGRMRAPRGLRVDGQRLDAYQIAENPGNVCWGHTHREYMAVDDLMDIGRGERLVRKIGFTRECNDCGVKHRHEVQLVVGPGEEMPREGELPTYREVEQQQQQLEGVRELYAQAEEQAAAEAESSGSGVELESDGETDSDEAGSDSESEEDGYLPPPRPVIMLRM